MRILLSVLFLVLSINTAEAQFSTASNNPDCFYTETLTSVTSTSGFDNRELKCSVWKVQILNASNNSVAYVFERSGSNSDYNAVGSPSGINTVTAGAATTYQTQDNFVRVRLTSTGTGNVIITISGYSYREQKNNVNVDAPPGVAYTLVRDVASASITYIGQAKSIFDPVTNTSYAVYAIQKLNYSAGELTSTQWADGDTEENNIWANRASLTYK